MDRPLRPLHAMTPCSSYCFSSHYWCSEIPSGLTYFVHLRSVPVRARVCVWCSQQRNKTSLRWSFLKYCVRGITTIVEGFLQEKAEALKRLLKATSPTPPPQPPSTTTSLDMKRKILQAEPTQSHIFHPTFKNNVQCVVLTVIIHLQRKRRKRKEPPKHCQTKAFQQNICEISNMESYLHVIQHCIHLQMTQSITR